MRALFTLACFVLVTASACFGQEPSTGGASRFLRGSRASAAPEPQRSGRLISVEVVIADVVGEAGPITAEELPALEKAGNVPSLSRLRLAALENQPSVVQFGERVTVVTGRTFGGGRAAQDMLAQENLGTMVSVTARVEPDETIVMEFQAEQTRLTPAPPRAEGENVERPSELPRTNTLTTKSTLRIPPGKSVVAGGKTTKTELGIVQTWILVSARADATAAGETAVLKIISLKNAQAEALAVLLDGIFRGDNFRAAVDARTNRLIVSASPAVLDKIIPLIAELDQAADDAAK